MRVKVILNPYADNGHGRQKIEAVAAAARPYGGVDLALTERPRHGVDLARQAAEAGYDAVAAAGGDGTVSDVMNGLMQAQNPAVRLGVIPVGSGNDLAWSAGIPQDVTAAVQRVFTGRPVKIDLAYVENEYGDGRFADNNIGVGFDAAVVIETETITRLRGFPMYFLAVLRAILFYFNTPRLQMRFDDETVTQEALFVAFGLGRRHGGGFLITPDARHDDGLIDTCTVAPVSRPTMLQMLLKVMKGTHVASPYVTMRQNKKIIIKSDTPLPIHVDGEMFAYPKDNVRQLTVASRPAAIELIV